MNSKFNILALTSIFVISSCSPTGSVYTTNIQDITSFEEGSYIYSLPKTYIVVEAEVVRHTVIPGPFHAYAKDFLSIEGAPNTTQTSWQLNNIILKSFNEPDPDHYYSVRDHKYGILSNQILALQKVGLVIPAGQYIPICDSSSILTEDFHNVYYSDLSVKRNIAKSEKDNFQRTLKDSAFADIPFWRDQLEVKTTAEKAKEASDFIFKIRKRRFKLMAGQYEIFPEGIALETSVREMNKLEAEYISLFIGKTYTDTIRRLFVIEPKAGEELQRHTIFRFSEQDGIKAGNSSRGDAVILEISDLGQTKNLKHLMIPGTSTTKENLLFYRIPDKASLKVLYGSHAVAEYQLPIAQFGAIVPFYINVEKEKK